MLNLQRAYMIDTTLRDGEQRPGCAFSAEQKLQIAQLLDRAGIYQIDAGTPAISTEERQIIREIVAKRARAKISVWCRMNLDDIKLAMECTPDIIHISAPISYVHIYSKLRKNKVWLQKQLLDGVALAQSGGFSVTVGFEDASRADISFVSALAALLQKEGVLRVQFSDTVGVMTPQRTYDCMREIILGGSPPVTFHGHNDLGMAVANSLAALRAGAFGIETTLLGLGERAGNCDLETLVRVAGHAYDLRPSLQNIETLTRKATSILYGCAVTVTGASSCSRSASRIDRCADPQRAHTKLGADDISS
jgi:homocitrate synthase NifV